MTSVTVVVSKTDTTDDTKVAVSDSMESNEASKIKTRDGLTGVVMG